MLESLSPHLLSPRMMDLTCWGGPAEGPTTLPAPSITPITRYRSVADWRDDECLHTSSPLPSSTMQDVGSGLSRAVVPIFSRPSRAFFTHSLLRMGFGGIQHDKRVLASGQVLELCVMSGSGGSLNSSGVFEY